MITMDSKEVRLGQDVGMGSGEEFSDDEDEMKEESDRCLLDVIVAQWQHELASISVIVVKVANVIILATKRADPIPYHMSILSGEAWVQELLTGHPERIRTELAIHKHVFRTILVELQGAKCTHSKHVTLEEQLMIFLYTCITGLSVRHVGERFQRSNATISKYVTADCISHSSDKNITRYFKKILFTLSSPPIYRKYVQLPRVGDPIHPTILDDPKLHLFFEDTIGAIDGTHIVCSPSAEERDVCRNRKGFMSQNCLVCCDFNMNFTYVLSRWEGSVADAFLYHNAWRTDFSIPDNKYYLADGGFPSCPQLLVLFRGQ